MYILGVDLGQSRDSTAVAIIERVDAPRGEQGPATYNLIHLERPPLGLPYPQVVERVATLMDTAPLDRYNCPLVVDRTGVGRAVFDMFDQAGIPARGLTITGGMESNILDPYDLRVPKRDLAGVLVALLQTGRLKVAASLPLARAFADELAAFRVKVTAAGNDSYEAWRESDHDDLVLSVALAAWWAEAFGQRQEQQPIFSTGTDRHVRVEQRRGFRPLG